MLSVRFSPNGKWFLSAGDDGRIHLWDIIKKSVLMTFKGDLRSDSGIAFSPNSRFVLTGEREYPVLWNARTGRCLGHFTGHEGWVYSVCFSRDGRQIFAGCGANVWMWNVKDFSRPIQSFSSHTLEVFSIATGPDGKEFLSASRDHSLRVWDIDTGRCRRTLRGHTDGVVSCAYSPGAEIVLSASLDKTLRLWAMQPSRPCPLQKSEPEQKENKDGSGNHYDLLTLEFEDCLTKGRFSDALITLYQLEHLPSGRQHPLTREMRRRLSTHFRLGQLAGAYTTRRVQAKGTSVYAVALTPDGRRAVFGGKDGTVICFDVEHGRLFKTSGRHGDSVETVAISRNGRQIFSGAGDKRIKLWHVSQEKCFEVGELEEQENTVTSISINQNETRIAAANGDGVIRIWDYRNRKCLFTYPQKISKDSDFGGPIVIRLGAHNSVAFSPDGKEVAFAFNVGDRCSIMLMNVETGQPQPVGPKALPFLNISTTVIAIAFSPDGKQLLVGGEDGHLGLLNISQAQFTTTFNSRGGRIRAVAFVGNDGTKALSGGEDMYLRLWDVNTGDGLGFWQEPGGEIEGFALSSDAFVLAVAAGLGVSIWHFDWDLK